MKGRTKDMSCVRYKTRNTFSVLLFLLNSDRKNFHEALNYEIIYLSSFEWLHSSIPLLLDAYKLERVEKREKGSHYDISAEEKFHWVNYN